MKKTFWDKRIPTLLGIFLITISVGITTFLVNQGTLFQINASPVQQPQNVRITNVTDSSFSVSYITDDSIAGSINYGKDVVLGQSGLDDRDQESGNLVNHKIHNITIRNLTPLTKYYFTITSGKDSYMNNDKPFEVTTGPSLTDSPSSQTPMTGGVVLPSGSKPLEAIIYLTTDSSQVISILVKPNGSYVLPLNSLRTSNLSSYYSFTKSSNITMLIFGDLLTSNVLLSLGEISHVPTVTLSNDYDFRTSDSPIASRSANLQSFPSFESSSSATSSAVSPRILIPKKDQGFTDQQPLFNGTALPSEEVQIIIHSDENMQTQVSTDTKGAWSFRPLTPLTPGNHTITIITKDANGILKSITQSFVIYASGTQVSQSATPSGTLTPTPTNTSTPTPTPTILGSTTLTSTPTLSPTLTPTPIEIAQFTPVPTKNPLPSTGNISIITAGIVGVFITLIGGLLFLLTRGGISAL